MRIFLRGDFMQINAVFEGGGVKAIALVGAVTEAERKGIRFHQVAGTSSGSIVASLLAAGYTGKEMEQIILNTPFSSFLQRSPLFGLKVLGPLVRFFIKKGLYSGDLLEQWIDELLKAKGIRTFGDLKRNQLRIIASDITQGKLLLLPDDIAQYGIDPKEFTVAKAVRMSTSIPYFFDPVVIRKPDTKANIFIVDGALLSNFPLWVFDEPKVRDESQLLPTIGFQLVGISQKAERVIKGPLTMLEALFATMMDAHDEKYISDHNRFRTIKIPTLGVQTTQFEIAPAMSLQLYQSGEAAANKYFDRWSRSMYITNLKATQ
jgi:NTE family protein